RRRSRYAVESRSAMKASFRRARPQQGTSAVRSGQCTSELRSGRRRGNETQRVVGHDQGFARADQEGSDGGAGTADLVERVIVGEAARVWIDLDPTPPQRVLAR